MRGQKIGRRNRLGGLIHEYTLVAEGIRFRNEIVEGPGGKQIVMEDVAGNPIELFEPA